MRRKVNDKTIRGAAQLVRDCQIFDTDVLGFSVTIYPYGNRAFCLDYRVVGHQRWMPVEPLIGSVKPNCTQRCLSTCNFGGRRASTHSKRPSAKSRSSPAPLDQQFSAGVAGLAFACDGVGRGHFLDPRPGEDLADLGHVVDRQQPASLDLCQLFGQALEIRAAEQGLAVVALAAPIGRVKVEEAARAVIAADEFAKVQAFDHHARQPCVQILQHRFQRGQVEPARPIKRHTEIAPRDFAAEGGALEVKKAGRPFQIGQRIGVGFDQPVEFDPGGQLEPQGVEELRIVPLQDAEQVGHIPARVIDHLGPGAHRSPQEDAAHADKGLGIGGAGDRIDDRADPLGEVALAAQPGRHGLHRIDTVQRGVHGAVPYRLRQERIVNI